jgi:hypothetical protein
MLLNISINKGLERCAYCKPPSVGQVDAANFASFQVMDQPVDGGVDVVNPLLVENMELGQRKLDAELALQVPHHCIHRIILLDSQGLGLLVPWTPNVSHYNKPVQTVKYTVSYNTPQIHKRIFLIFWRL